VCTTILNELCFINISKEAAVTVEKGNSLMPITYQEKIEATFMQKIKQL